MFIGEYQHSVDEKGRMAIPVRFRKSLASGVVVTKGLEICLEVYPIEQWERLATRVSQLPINQANSRAISRHILGGAANAEIDSQGRILIPEYLRKHAGIESKGIMVGLYNRFEIWSEDRWNEYRAKIDSNTEEIAEKLGELGIS